MKPRERSTEPRDAPAERPVALEIRDDQRVEFHFPVEVYLEDPAEPVDVHQIAEQVYERLIRRIDET